MLRKTGVLLISSILAFAAAGLLASGGTTARLVLGGLILLLMLGLSYVNTSCGLLVLLLWLWGLGSIRRIVTYYWVPAATADALLAVYPGAVVLLLLFSRYRCVDRLDRDKEKALILGVAVLQVWVLVTALRPDVGSVGSGLQGLLFVGVPMLAFWLGLELRLEQFLYLFRTIPILGLMSAVYGVLQTELGFPVWDAYWIESQGYSALGVGSVVRGFANFSSAAEYVTFLALSVFLCIFLFPRYLWPVKIGYVGFVGWALLLGSSRGIIVYLVVACVVAFCAVLRLRLIWVFALSACSLLSVSFGAERLLSTFSSNDLLVHQAEGLANPGDDDSSTLSIHLELFVSGLSSAFTSPLGSGLQAVTIAGRSGGEFEDIGSSEIDASNAAIALGILGLALFLFVCVLVLWKFWFACQTRVSDRRQFVLFLGVLLVSFNQWLNGGQYLVAFLVWLAIGGGVALLCGSSIGRGGNARSATLGRV